MTASTNIKTKFLLFSCVSGMFVYRTVDFKFINGNLKRLTSNTNFINLLSQTFFDCFFYTPQKKVFKFDPDVVKIDCLMW